MVTNHNPTPVGSWRKIPATFLSFLPIMVMGVETRGNVMIPCTTQCSATGAVPIDFEIPPSPAAAYAIPGAFASRFSRAIDDHLITWWRMMTSGGASFHMGPVARYWFTGIAASAGCGAITAIAAFDRPGDSFFDRSGRVVSIVSGSLAAVSLLPAAIARRAAMQNLPRLALASLNSVAFLTNAARIFGGGAGILFSVGDVLATVEEPGVSNAEIGLSVASAASSLATIAIASAPLNGFPVAGTAAFVTLLGAAFVFGMYKAKIRQERITSACRETLSKVVGFV